jgi:hypothetical protein
MPNDNLRRARQNRRDEFYTRIEDIEEELKHYKNFFKGKTVLCNCDDPRMSNFFHYFSYSFEHLGLKKLITTCYKNQNADLFSQGSSEQAVYLEYTGDKNGNRIPDPEEIGIKPLKGDGDFRSEECIKLLKEADVVVTNPPFSLFREYVAQLIKYDKKFLIIGNKNAITFKEIFKLMQENKLWIGYRNINKDMWLYLPEDTEQYEKLIDGRKTKHIMAFWLTNIETTKRHEDLELYKRYNPQEYPKYVNYDAINVDKTADIPVDYDGVMGVPITFLDKYNPDQFEIVELGIVGSCTFKNNRKMEILDKNGQPTGKYTYNAKGTLYRTYNPETDRTPAFKDVETGALYSSIYARILIRKRR